MNNSGLASLTNILYVSQRKRNLHFLYSYYGKLSDLSLPSQIITPTTNTLELDMPDLLLIKESLDLCHSAELFALLVTMATSGKSVALPAKARLLVYTDVLAGAVLRPRFQLRLQPASIYHAEFQATALIATRRHCKVKALPVFFKRCTFNS